MNKKKYISFIAIGVLVLLGIYLIATYNSLVNKDEKVKLQWNEVENAYQRRLSLIPNLVNVVKGQADFEQTTLQKIAEARSKAAGINLTGEVSADKYSQHNAVQNELATATNNLIISIEKYPSLKGTAAFAGLQTQLEGTENRVKIARKDFNESIAVYNNAARSFPTSLVAGLFSFKAKEGFQADTNSDKSIVIKF
jgi:LemA protein